MLHGDALGLLLGAVALGAVHGVEPGHGWPVAASYALDQSNKWLYGFAASFLLGLGHLVSSIAMVAAFFWAKSTFELTQVNDPVALGTADLGVWSGTVTVGGPVSLVAGVLLVALGVREYTHGHSHAHGGADHSHGHGGADHSHAHGDLDEATDRGLWGIAWFAFLLGFAHEEEFEIIALCAGSTHCLELMTAYALTVIAGIVALTLLLIAGYHRFEERVEAYTDYLPAFSAAVLVTMGLGFVVGVF
jgi:hypothetical protein